MSKQLAFSMRIDEDTELRLHEERYAQEYFELIDRNRARLREWMPWLDHENTVEDTREYIRSTLKEFADNTGITTGIWYRGQIVGSIGLHALDWLNHKVEMGYWLGAEYEGKGLVTKACRTLITYAYESFGFNRVEIHCAVGNRRSRAIPERLGFTQEGIIRQAEWLYDHYVDLVFYGLLADEWAAAPQG